MSKKRPRRQRNTATSKEQQKATREGATHPPTSERARQRRETRWSNSGSGAMGVYRSGGNSNRGIRWKADAESNKSRKSPGPESK